MSIETIVKLLVNAAVAGDVITGQLLLHFVQSGSYMTLPILLFTLFMLVTPKMRWDFGVMTFAIFLTAITIALSIHNVTFLDLHHL